MDNNQALFAEKLNELKDLASMQGNVVSKEQVEEQFSYMKLNKAQKELIYDYLHNEKIGIDEPVNPDDYLTEDDKKYIDMYLEELSEIPTPDDSVVDAYLIQAMAGERDVFDKLITAFLPQVVDIAKMYVGQGVSYEDLIGEGNVALAVLMDMLGSQDSPKECREMIASMVMQAMEELIEENKTEVESFDEWARSANEVLDKAKEMSEELLRKVTIEELCKEYDLDPEMVKNVCEVTGNAIEFIEIKE